MKIDVMAPLIRRQDYQRLAYRIERTELRFVIDGAAVEVFSRLHIVRDPAQPFAPLRLNGEDLETQTLFIDDQPLALPNDLDESGELLLKEEKLGFVFSAQVRLAPHKNTHLSGLYASNSGLFTQCEAEGFRRITWFADRPDVMSVYTVTIEAPTSQYEVLLSNGNLQTEERWQEKDGREWQRAVWADPFAKPCYLFALVAANLAVVEQHEKTASGREVLLQIYTENGMQDRAAHAMQALVQSMHWDEQCYGLELDLDRYMVVVTTDFNMGAMENKGLNVFNAKYVLAKPQTATDRDFELITTVIGHEYFHNWTGNRVTCRDWFQLTLKEGLTVFRDQQFTADMLAATAGETGAASARAVKRIEDVNNLRNNQFPEDAGSMAHPIRPESYQAIDNFYTQTVYEKGAEVIRMLQVILGQQGFRQGMDLYFARHDGQAVTCDDFVTAMADANKRDLTQFMNWYRQKGTPEVQLQKQYHAASGTLKLQFRQQLPATEENLLLHIPIKFGLLGQNGKDLPCVSTAYKQFRVAEEGNTTFTIELHEQLTEVVIDGLIAEPVVSALREFSAPVRLLAEESLESLFFRWQNDSDPVSRWDAGQRALQTVLLMQLSGSTADNSARIAAVFATVIKDNTLDDAYRVLLLNLPDEAGLIEMMTPADPQRLRRVLIGLQTKLADLLHTELLQLLQHCTSTEAYLYQPKQAGRRKLLAWAIRQLCLIGDAQGISSAETLFANADNMTDRFNALAALTLTGKSLRERYLAEFYQRHQQDALVLDKWFSLQALAWRSQADDEPVLSDVKRLMQNPGFSLRNPNKIYALLLAFCRNNFAEFHRQDGSAYQFWAGQVLAVDAINPSVAARLARCMDRWPIYLPELQQHMLKALKRVQASEHLSAETREIIQRAIFANKVSL